MSSPNFSFKLSQSNLSSLHSLMQEAETAVKAMEAVKHRKEYVQKQLNELDEVLSKHTERAEAAVNAYHVAELKLLEEITVQSREAIKKEEEDRLRAEEERLKAEAEAEAQALLKAAEEAKKLEQEFVKDESQPSAPPVEALEVSQLNKEDLPPAQAPSSESVGASEQLPTGPGHSGNGHGDSKSVNTITPPCTPNTPRVKGGGISVDELVDDYVELRPSPVIEIRKKK